jgi:MFS transporter, ACS family, tartrate transporter
VAEEHEAFAKAGWRLIPFLVLLFVVAYVDRVNVGFAALTMNKDLGLSNQQFGFAAGVFFFGYFLFEVPSNVILERIGARRWIFCIILVWGLISTATALVTNVSMFYALRFALGVAESGFFPGMILYLTYWFPPPLRARYGSFFLAAIPLSNVIGAPISGEIIKAGGVLGLAGWQWLFILEGLPATLLAFVVLAYLPDNPQDARWLSEAEKAVIGRALVREDTHERHHLWAGLLDPRVWILSLIYFGIVVGVYGVNFWLPQIVHGHGFDIGQTGYVVAAPYLLSVGAMILWARSSDAFGERIWHVAIPALAASVGLFGAAIFQRDMASLGFLTLAAVGIYATLAPFWSLPSKFLGGTAAAGGIALINAIGNLGGFCGPFVVGWLKDRTGSYAAGIEALGASLIAAAILVVVLGRAFGLRARAKAFDKFAPPTA